MNKMELRKRLYGIKGIASLLRSVDSADIIAEDIQNVGYALDNILDGIFELIEFEDSKDE